MLYMFFSVSLSKAKKKSLLKFGPFMRFQVIDDLKIYNKSCPVYLQSHILDIF